MTVAHFLYVPGVLLLGLAFGYTLGARAVRAELAELKRRAKQ